MLESVYDKNIRNNDNVDFHFWVSTSKIWELFQVDPVLLLSLIKQKHDEINYESTH